MPRPYVICHMIPSLDGRIVTAKWGMAKRGYDAYGVGTGAGGGTLAWKQGQSGGDVVRASRQVFHARCSRKCRQAAKPWRVAAPFPEAARAKPPTLAANHDNR